MVLLSGGTGWEADARERIAGLRVDEDSEALVFSKSLIFAEGEAVGAPTLRILGYTVHGICSNRILNVRDATL